MSQFIAVCLIVLGGLLIIGVRLPKFSVKSRTKDLSRRVEQMTTRTRRKKETAGEYAARISGREKENFARRSHNEAKHIFEYIGQSDRYQHTVEFSLLAGLAGLVLGLLLRNVPLAAVLAVGLYFLPLWLSRFTLYRFQRFVSEDLETSLNLITTSYLRSNDILNAVEENLAEIKEPVRSVFTSFVNNLKYVDANAPAQIERMKLRLDNKLFWEWCDVLILCQDNHLLQAALPPIVKKFSALKVQQAANETRMMLPLKNAATMAGLVIGFAPILKLVNEVWYANLMHTAAGQLVFAGSVIAVLVTINKAIKLSEPITYNL